MLKRIIFAAFFTWFFPLTANPPFAHASIPNTELPNLVEKALPQVVNISSVTIVRQNVYGMDDFFRLWGIPQERKQSSLGSGFILDSDGFVITNNHVVEHASEVIVTLYDKRSFHAKIIGKDPKVDLALLRIQDKNKKVPADLVPAKLANSDEVRIGEPVFAVGNPFGFSHTVTAGILSAKHRTIGQGPYDNFLQTDASINPGNSGGPLFNFKGEVIGINTAIVGMGQSAGVGFSIPVNDAREILADLKRYGRVPRPWLGLLAERVTPALANYYNLSIDQGIVVYNLVEGAPSDIAGIRRGDIIIAADGITTVDLQDLEKSLYKHKPGETLTLRLRRGGRNIEVQVRLKELPPRLKDLPKGII